MTISVYLDQNVFGHMLDADPDWRKTPIGAELNHDDVQVWVTPTHVVELLLLTSNPSRRTALAGMMLDVCDRRRMGVDYAHLVVRELLGRINGLVNGSCRSAYVDHYADEMQRTFLGALALLALGFPAPDSVVSQLQVDKLVNRLLVARGKEDPNAWLNSVLDAVDNGRFVEQDPTATEAAKSRESLLAEVEKRDANGVKLSKSTRQKLQKRRQDIVRAYATGDLANSLQAVLNRLPLDLPWTFSAEELRTGWAVMEAKGCPPDAAAGGLDKMLPWIFETVGWNIMPTAVASEVVLLEYEARFGDGAKSTSAASGVSFDADHAAFALTKCDVFVCHDAVLLSSASTIAKRLKALGLQRRVVSKPAQLQKALAELRGP